MKKVLFAMAAVAMIFATSCKKDNNAPENIVLGEGEFLATIDNGAMPQNAPAVSDGMSTKTTIRDDSYVTWEEGDQISVNGATFTTDMSGSTVKFTGSGASGSTFTAYYPAELKNGMPAEQTYVPGKVSNLPMYATCGSERELTFHNICAVLKITIPAFLNGVDRIEVSSDKRMNGAFTVNTVADKPVMTLGESATDADKKLTIRKSSGTFAENEVVYIAVPAQTYGKLKFEFFDGDNSVWAKTSNSTFQLNVNTINTFPLNAMPNALCFKAKGGSVTVTFNIKNVTHQIQTSIDGGVSWQNYTSGTGIALAENERVYFRAESDQSTATAFGTGSESTCSKFIFSGAGTVEASGNIMSLYGPSCPDVQLNNYAFNYLFSGCTLLTTAPELPATKLQKNCYESMFQGCTALTSAPATLPATTLTNYCYSSLFKGCSALTNAPVISATSMGYACCQSMFEGCTSLTTAPTLSATTLASFCYKYMFKGCTSLTTAQTPIQATQLKTGCCYGMFEGCTSLTTGPTTISSTSAMEQECCKSMFKGCTKLKTPPTLPATELAQSCYHSMFDGCTSLTTAPELPAATLQSYCYQYMFQNCSKISSVTMKATTVNSGCLTYWLNGAGTSTGVTNYLYVDNSVTSNTEITNNKGNFTVQSYNPPAAP